MTDTTAPKSAIAGDDRFDAVIEKTSKGFGIYFAKVPSTVDQRDQLVVDGFVEDSEQDDNAKTTQDNDAALAALQLGDILVAVNGTKCQKMEVADILGLLRSAAAGANTLSFVRPAQTIAEPDTEKSSSQEITETSTGGFMGALLKVKSKIQAEIDGGEDELLREQLEDERFEMQWLEEFEGLKKQYETKWETCTYTADEFCGLLYRSSDAQQKEFLLREYPTLMEAWKDPRATSSSSRVIPEWPAAKVAYEDAIYESSDDPRVSSDKKVALRSIHCSQPLQQALDSLRVNFIWRPVAVQALSRRLEAEGISSCAALLEALDMKCGYFERSFQSTEYPRLSKTMLRSLRDAAEKAASTLDRRIVSAIEEPIELNNA